MKKILFILLIIIQFYSAWSQNDNSTEKMIYQFNRKVEIPVTIGFFASNYLGFHLLNEKKTLDASQIVSLDINDVWFFDRLAVTQPYSSSARENARKLSDWGVGTSFVLPALLFLDKKIQKDYLDILLLYLETQAISSTLYVYPGPLFTKRIRPFAYYPEIPIEEKLLVGSTDSFFSGHTTSAATASFFMAKVYTDYHPETKGKKWLFYTAAIIPPAFVGYYRYKALKHFPTDVLTGMAVGAAVGILIPELHKFRPEKIQNLSIVPFTGSITGLTVQFEI